MQEIEALYERRSVKHYLDEPLKEADRQALLDAIAEINAVSGLHIQLMEDEPAVFRHYISRATGLISARHYFALVGPKNPQLGRQVGYWGQRLVLFAQSLGLRTNWTGGSRRLGASTAQVDKGEKLVIVIAVGYGEDNGKERETRSLEELCAVPDGLDNAPEWFISGMKAAQAAPTGFNRQKFRIILHPDGTCEAKDTALIKLTDVDLGTVMYNFEVGARPHTVTWRNPV
ncbi:MAG: hypothetical protein IKS49_05175 [Actinomycetaceae bacterium]|nr:hypothetical protein [Actinomycetaceae bacterium]